MTLKIFAVSAPGMEPFTAQEITRLGTSPSQVQTEQETPAPNSESDAGGVEFEGDLSDVYRANLHLRTVNRVLVRLSTFYATEPQQLITVAGRLPWNRYLQPGQPVALRVTCHQSRLHIEDSVARMVQQAIGDRLGAPTPQVRFAPLPNGLLPQLIVVRLVHNRCTISVDSSGELLHRRGYRLAAAKAPLRETLAAGMLLASGWDCASPLLDPFCGSGTIPIEAALLALGRAPGINRRFAFMNWPGFDAALWKELAGKAQGEIPAQMPPILASDRDAGAIEMARANAARAGVARWIEFSHQPVSAIQPPPGPGWVVTNPPYGVRVSTQNDLRNLYAQIGNVLRLRCPGWQAAILCSDEKLVSFTRLHFSKGVALVNGGIPVKLARAVVPIEV